MKPQKIALLDLGGVVFQSTGESNETIHWDIISQLNHRYGHGLNLGEDLFPIFLKEYNQLTQQQLEGKEFLKAVFDTLELNQELIDIVSQEHRIIIVSDNYRENIAYISQRYRFAEWSEAQFYSYDFEMEKADPRFFPRLLTEIPYDKELLTFIDDSPRKIESAQQHGIRSILFQSNAQVLRAL